MKKGKPVWHPPVFDEFSIGKSTDVHDIDGHWLARARIDARLPCCAPKHYRWFPQWLLS